MHYYLIMCYQGYETKGQHPLTPKGRWPSSLCRVIHGEPGLAVTGWPGVGPILTNSTTY
jgi:hypothetical protein